MDLCPASNTLVIVASDHSNSHMRNQRVLGAGTLYGDAGLAAIMAEWVAPTPTAVRVNNLKAGVGPGGVFKLVRDETVFDDGQPDLRWGDAGNDWFLASAGDMIRDLRRGDLV